MDRLVELGIMHFAKNLMIALLILLIGLYLIRSLQRLIENRMERKRVDPSLQSFLLPLVRMTLLIVLGITVIRQLGVEATSLIALITSAGLAVGLALQGSLSNVAGGVLILLLKPFRVGDYIEVDDYRGTVKNISIYYTELKTDDGQQVVIPNGDIVSTSVVNYSTYPEQRFDLTIPVSYQDDPIRVRQLLQSLMHEVPTFLEDPAPSVFLKGFTEHAIEFTLRGWVRREHYRETLDQLLPLIKKTFNQENIMLPYPQLVVHLHPTSPIPYKKNGNSGS